MLTHTTRSQIKTIIRSMLGEDGVFWPDNDLNLAIEEALLTFGAMSNFWQEEIFIETQLGKRIYDIFIDVNNVNSITPNVKVQKIIDWLNVDLVENISEASPESELFSLEEFIAKLKQVYNIFQRQTGLVLTVNEQDAGAGNNLIDIPNEVIDIVRISFIYTNDNNDSAEIFLQKADEKELQYFSADFITEADLPSYYTNVYNSNSSVRLYPPPIINGKLKIISVNTLGEEEITIDSVVPLPNNLIPYLKYGIEKEIFNKDGIIKDQGRFAYCNKRWNEGIMIGQNYNSILLAKVNGILINTDSMHQMDLYTPDFLTPATGPVEWLGIAGLNIIQTNNLPDVEIDSINLTCAQNAIIPRVDADQIQIEKSYINIIAGYCFHIMQMKSGVFDLAATSDELDNFLKTALAHNQRLQLRGITFEKLSQSTKEEEQAEPKIVSVVNNG